MTILAQTSEYLAKFESNMLTISRYSDGNCIALKGHGIAKNFRDCVKQSGQEQAIQTFIRVGERINPKWSLMYKPNRMPRGIK